MPLTLRGSWPEADFIASSEVQGGRSRADHPGASIRQARKQIVRRSHQNDEGINDEQLAKL